MPEEILKSTFDLLKTIAGKPVKVTIYGQIDGSGAYKKDKIVYGYILEARHEQIVVGAYDSENEPVFCKITPSQVLEELVKVEVL